VGRMKIIEKKVVPMAIAKEIMLKREKKGELTYEQKIALEHLRKFTKLSKEKAENLMKEISSFVRLSDEILVQIVDIMPKTRDELRLITAMEKFSLREDEMDKILEIVKKYL
jgi:DNA-directed RNA polymerase subunit F